MNSIYRKESYRLIHTKRFWILAAVMLLNAGIPLTDCLFADASILTLGAEGYHNLLSYGGGMFMGFPFCVIFGIILSVGIVFHSEFLHKTFYYEKMNGLSAVQSTLSRFVISGSTVIFTTLGILSIFAFYFLTDGNDLRCGAIDFILHLLCFMFSGIQVAFVTVAAVIYFQSGYKAIIFSFLRYIIVGFLWSSIGGDADHYYIQIQALDPFNAMSLAFEGDILIMDNYWIILSMVVLSLLIHVFASLLIVETADRRRDY